MNNTPEEILNSTLLYLPPFDITQCLKKIHFGFVVSYSVLTVCFLIGTPANSWCLYFYLCSEKKIYQTHMFLLIHIIIELNYCLVCFGKITYMFFFQNIIFYKVVHFLLCLSWSGRPLIQTCICIEQYLAVCHPVTFLRFKGIKYRNAAAVVVWLMSLGYAVYHVITLVYPDAVSNSLFTVAMVVISFCCVSVLFALKHPGPGDTRTGRDVENQQKRNAFDTIFSAFILMLFSYFPQSLLNIFTVYKEDSVLLRCSIIPFMTAFNVFGVMVTPLMKMYKAGHFKCLKC